jgi:CHASE3 domain sensor protein
LNYPSRIARSFQRCSGQYLAEGKNILVRQHVVVVIVVVVVVVAVVVVMVVVAIVVVGK